MWVVTKNEIFASLNAPDAFHLALVGVGASSIGDLVLSVEELLARAANGKKGKGGRRGSRL
jgi:hypothetical protein